MKILDSASRDRSRPTTRAPRRHPRGPQSGHVLGTAGYMAPEQVRGQPIDGRADLFAFGVVLFEMVTGQRAFAGRRPSKR